MCSITQVGNNCKHKRAHAFEKKNETRQEGNGHKPALKMHRRCTITRLLWRPVHCIKIAVFFHPTTLILIRNQRCYFLAESPHCSGLFAFVPFGYIKKDEMSGRYIEPFTFSRESCPSTAHTFVISPEESFKLYEENEEYRTRLDTGDYVYVEGHLCLNDPAYIVPTSHGPRMTDWANRHEQARILVLRGNRGR